MTVDIRKMERERGYAEASFPLYGILFGMSLSAGAWHFAIVTGLLAAFYGWGWWLFWATCRDYDRAAAEERASAWARGEGR